MTLERGIRTRLLEALWKETVSCFARAALGLVDAYGGTDKLRIYCYPIFPGDSIVPRQVNISPAPFSFDQDTGGITNSTYDYEVTFTFPPNILKHEADANTYLDEIDALRVWLFNGGSVENRNGRLQDPDSPGELINNRIASWQERSARYAPGMAGIEVSIIVGFETREDRAGNRV